MHLELRIGQSSDDGLTWCMQFCDKVSECDDKTDIISRHNGGIIMHEPATLSPYKDNEARFVLIQR